MSTTTEVPERVAPIVEGGLRPQLAPHAAVGTLVVAAVACRVAVHAVGDERTVAVWVAGSAFVIAVVAATRVRRRVFDKRARRRALAFLGVAVGWLTGVTLAGLSLGAVGLLMAVAYALSMHWWRQHPVGLIQPKVTRSGYQRLWAENNGASDGALPGSRLTAEEPIAAGVRYALKLRAGKQTLEMAIAAMGRLRGGLHLQADQQMLLEPHPTEPEPTLLLTIVTRSPIKQAVDWPGPSAFDSATGRVRLGPFADGEGVATWRAYTDNRLWGGFIQGGTGSGKSRLIDSIAFSLAASESHPTVIFYADGQRGASSPLLMRHADLFAGTFDRIHAMLVGLELLMLLRQQENVEMEVEGFRPIADRPGVLGIIDECHKPLDKEQNPALWKETQRIASTVAREGGKVGIALLLASQEPTLGAFGGAGSPYCEALRSSLLTGNGIMLAGDDPNAKTIFGVEDNPKKFPRFGGYGMVTKPAPGERQAHFRSYYLNDRLQKHWPSRIEWRGLSDPAENFAMGSAYGARERSYADRKASLAGVRLRATREPEPQPATGGDGAALESFGLAPFPRWTEFVTQAQREALKALGPSHEKVLDAIRAGHTSPQRIADTVDLSVRRVHQLLGDLAEAGRVRGGGRQYEVAA
ncbi:hypothetical protein [Micromonospora chokoriensis]|uniref:hypothetical protein n=1 Tax=Micromonospora chokoriensis TaxID=356851 RepID=UPI0004C42FD0|nr:hypothetical protein [Micromonospora chokoriensis]